MARKRRKKKSPVEGDYNNGSMPMANRRGGTRVVMECSEDEVTDIHTRAHSVRRNTKYVKVPADALRRLLIDFGRLGQTCNDLGANIVGQSGGNKADDKS